MGKQTRSMRHFHDDQRGLAALEAAIVLPVLAVLCIMALGLGLEGVMRARLDRAAATAAAVWLDNAWRAHRFDLPLPASATGVPLCSVLVARQSDGSTVLLQQGRTSCPTPPASTTLSADEIELVVWVSGGVGALLGPRSATTGFRVPLPAMP